MGTKKQSKFGIFLRKVFKRASIGSFILGLIDLSALVDDAEIKEMLSEIKKDVKNKKVVIDAKNAKDFIYILSVLADEDISDLAEALRETRKLIEEDKD